MVISQRAEPTLLTDQVYSMIRAAILSGDLPSGSRLKVRDLAEQVGTSVMPVREAIRRLEEIGLAEREPHKGAVVKTLTFEELIHVYDVRRLLETEAARLGSENVSSEDCDRMQAEYDLMRKAIDERQVIPTLDHDEAMLAILYQAAGNPVLLQMIRSLWQQCRAYKIVGAQGSLDNGNDDSLWRYQQDLITAARNSDPAAAAAVNSASLLDASERIKARLADQSSA
ncbi:GntR family transcriptional regulator [Arthrobacter bambusae]|uniref:GntR family transcriptional regulator n=1 Tax=Arthrobacter bambusae TaxID=1338426 RepID=UPI0027890485|nr:GntR family transcriptional regulator [Arthrobacter bambusae]MDQ0212436.1 DNA-binding GntR family transcriptional regulator [Arthrobacter bambusae]MDQ0236884.1 DNA-binding GntR family transcriptional regulator [Arthrobacter bambusae]